MKADFLLVEQLPQYHRYKAEFIYAHLKNLVNPHRDTIKILDVGCGTGELLTLPLSQLFSTNPAVQILGTDIHEESILRALENSQRVGLSNITFSTDSNHWQQEQYDIVICSEVIEHVENTKNFLTILKKHVKPGGYLVITIPNGYGAFEIESFFYHQLKFKNVWGFLKKIIRSSSIEGKSLPTRNFEETLNKDNNIHIHHFGYWNFLNTLKDFYFQNITCQGIIFFGGPLSNRLMERMPWLFRLNIHLARKLPVWLSAGWIFICED